MSDLSVERVRASLQVRAWRLAESALDVIEGIMKAPERHSATQLTAARMILELAGVYEKLEEPTDKRVRPVPPTLTEAQAAEARWLLKERMQ